MKILKKNVNANPKISLILLDWSVRESFHLLHYLSKQSVPRDTFEVVLIEYYSTLSKAALQFENEIDTWIQLEMPTDCYYHKHLMYNAGILFSNGEICVICDSDAMVKENFIKTILSEFEKQPNIVLHLDQFRNNRRDFYPFNYPSFEEVIGKGCINYKNGVTQGLADSDDPLHKRNYGACMCAPRANLIAIGGADEHIDYVGHICGPYDLTFRLSNYGLKEIWHTTEFMYHTWHPGQAGVDNYLGPHDGRHMSTTALRALITGRILPLTENKAIQFARTNNSLRINNLSQDLINPLYPQLIKRNNLDQLKPVDSQQLVSNYLGFKIEKGESNYVAYSINNKLIENSPTVADLQYKIRNIYSSTILLKRKSVFGLIWLFSKLKQILFFTTPILKKITHFFKNIYQNSIRRGLAASQHHSRKLFYQTTKLFHKAKHGVITGRKRFAQKMIYYKENEQFNYNTMSTLLDSLFFMANEYSKADLKNFILLTQPAEKNYLTILQRLALLPKLPIKAFENQNQIEEFLNIIRNEHSDKKIIISSSLYITYYSKFGSGFAKTNIII